MRVRMSSFTCTLTGGSQFAICNLRNLREHFLKITKYGKININADFFEIYLAESTFMRIFALELNKEDGLKGGAYENN